MLALLRQICRPLFGLFVLSMMVHTGHAQCCYYHLSMHDSYGDGWNGGQLKVYVNNNVVGSYAAANFASADTFLVCNGDSLALVYSSGAYENENSYQLYDANFHLLYHDRPTLLTGFVFDTLGHCNTAASFVGCAITMARRQYSRSLYTSK